MGHNSFIAIYFGFDTVIMDTKGFVFGVLRFNFMESQGSRERSLAVCKEGISVQYKGTRLSQIFMLMVHEQEQHLPFARVVFFQAPTPVNSVTRGDIDEVKLSTAFPDKQNVFEIHTKSGLVWYLQSNSNVRISIILLTILL